MTLKTKPQVMEILWAFPDREVIVNNAVIASGIPARDLVKNLPYFYFKMQLSKKILIETFASTEN